MTPLLPMPPAPWPTALGLLTVGLPLIVALLAAARRTRLAAALLPWTVLPALALALMPGRLEAFPWLLLGARLGTDDTSRLFLLFSAILWGCAGSFARHYLAADPRRARFTAFFALAQAGNMTLLLAHDMAAFYTGFALMSFASYPLIVHSETPEARRAGRLYLSLAVTGEVLQFAAFSLIALGITETRFEQVAPAIAASPWRGWITALLLAGFGIKAGLVPLHVWLPLAHPAAPTPASAVLSGVMIKAGLLAWLRFLPLDQPGFETAGAWIVGAGLAGLFGAALIGALQTVPKTVLAYSSISQMGLIAIAIGVALHRGDPALAPVATAAVALYALHHGLAKGLLFLGVGVWTGANAQARRLASPILLLGALALAGAPFTSGAVAKLALKPIATAGPWPWLPTAMTLGAAGTTLLMIRFLQLLHREAREDARAHHPHHALPAAAWRPWVLLALAVLGLIWLIIPDPAATARTLITPAYILGSLGPIGLGLALATLGWRRIFPTPPPGDLLVLVPALIGAPLQRLTRTSLAALQALNTRGAQARDRLGRRLSSGALGLVPVLESKLRHWPIAYAALLLTTLLLTLSVLLQIWH